MVVLDVAKLGFLMGDYRLFNETSQGDHWIFDFSNATLNHAMQFTPILMSKIYYHITVCFLIFYSCIFYTFFCLGPKHEFYVVFCILKFRFDVHVKTRKISW